LLTQKNLSTLENKIKYSRYVKRIFVQVYKFTMLPVCTDYEFAQDTNCCGHVAASRSAES